MLRLLPILLAAAFCGSLRAHTVPVVVIEAEFGDSREAVIKVNLDPRLFLTQQPTAVPPVPASWWFDQEEASQGNSRKAAADYVARTFAFTVGATPLAGDWKAEPIDSASAFPLGEASAEVHLLVEHRGALPASAGDFKVAVGKECPVAVILLCSNAGDPERRPQSLFPGESSRGFPLPALPKAGADVAASTETDGGAGDWAARLAWLARSAHFIGDHLALAALLGFALPRHRWRALGLLAGFHVADILAASAVLTGWLPSAPLWMTLAYWAALTITAVHLFVLKSKAASALATLVVAGLCHGLNTPHLHLEGGTAAATQLFAQSGLLIVFELVVLVICASLAHLAQRRRTQRPCTGAA